MEPLLYTWLNFHVLIDRVDKMVDEIRAEMLVKTAAIAIVDKCIDTNLTLTFTSLYHVIKLIPRDQHQVRYTSNVTNPHGSR